VTFLGANGAGKSQLRRSRVATAFGRRNPVSKGQVRSPALGRGHCASRHLYFPKCVAVFPACGDGKQHAPAPRTRRVAKSNWSREAAPVRPVSSGHAVRFPMRSAGPYQRALHMGVAVRAVGLMRAPPLGLGRAIACLAPVIVQAVFRIISEIRPHGTVLLVEQTPLGFRGGGCRHATFLIRGRSCWEASPTAVGQRAIRAALSRVPCQSSA